jgi:DNA-binding protein HU-beta
MNKMQMIEAIKTETGFTKKDSEIALNGIIAVVQDTVAKGEDVSICGFGKWAVANRVARNGINPQTGAKLTIPAKKAPVFKAGKIFKDMVAQA